MTIDEFKKNIAPHMNKGWVAMDEDGEWNWWVQKPQMKYESYWWVTTREQCCLSDGFDIAPVDDWTKSLIEVGRK